MEYALLRTALRRRIGPVGTPRSFLALLWGLAGLAAVLAGGLRLAQGLLPPLALSLAGLAVYAAAYVALARLAGVREVAAVLARIPGRRR